MTRRTGPSVIEVLAEIEVFGRAGVREKLAEEARSGTLPCAELSADEKRMFFPVRGEATPEQAERIAAVCGPCPLRVTCAAVGAVDNEHGWWGGLSEHQRRDVRRHARRSGALGRTSVRQAPKDGGRDHARDDQLVNELLARRSSPVTTDEVASELGWVWSRARSSLRRLRNRGGARALPSHGWVAA